MRLVLTRNSGIILVFGLLFLCSCTVEKHYRALSFFFDGVPSVSDREQDEQAETGGVPSLSQDRGRQAVTTDMEAQKTVFVHRPYSNRECERCHDRTSATFFRVPIKELCYLCHERAKFQGAYVHGPVAVHQCGTCHEPHQSRYPNLLKQEGEQLCFLCHQEASIRRIPKHADRSDCLRCHDPHSHDNPNFLKQNAGEEQ